MLNPFRKPAANVVVAVLGLCCLSPAASQPADDPAKLFSKTNVYDNNQFGMNINGVWFWMNNPRYLVAIRAGGAAYNIVDVASFERVQVRGGSDLLVMRLRSGDMIRAPMSEAKWIACRDIEVGRTACEKGGRITGMTYADRRDDLDLVFSHAVIDNIRKIRLFWNAISTSSSSRPDFSLMQGPVDVLANAEFKIAQKPFEDYALSLKAQEAEHREKQKVTEALAKLKEPETRARLQQEAQQELNYWKAPAAGARMACETSYGVGANPGSMPVSLADADQVQCKGHAGKEVRMGLLAKAGWKVVEQGSRPYSNGVLSSQFLVYAQVVLQKM